MPASVSAPPAFESFDTTRDECNVAAWKNITIVLWRRQATIAAVGHLSEITRAFVAQHPEGFSNVHIVARGLPRPTAEARAGLERLTAAVAPRLACVATILEGQDLRARAIRAISVGIRAVTQSAYTFRMHSRVESVGAWLPAEHRARTGVELDPEELVRALQKARNQAGIR